MRSLLRLFGWLTLSERRVLIQHICILLCPKSKEKEKEKIRRA